MKSEKWLGIRRTTLIQYEQSANDAADLHRNDNNRTHNFRNNRIYKSLSYYHNELSEKVDESFRPMLIYSRL